MGKKTTGLSASKAAEKGLPDAPPGRVIRVAHSEKAVQGLHDRFEDCKKSVQVLHSHAAHCEKAVQALHSRFTHSERAVQVLHSHAAHCERATQALHGRFTHCERAVQVLHSHFTL